jgi:hypothetical protein
MQIILSYFLKDNSVPENSCFNTFRHVEVKKTCLSAHNMTNETFTDPFITNKFKMLIPKEIINIFM